MPSYERDHATIFYDDEGDASGHPVLLLAPGGMRSFNDKWNDMPWNPRAQLLDQGLRVIGIDQRYTGRSTAPVSADSGWADYRDDQLGLLDHLGVAQCSLIGMCIGGPFIANLLTTSPDRFNAAVLLQPVGVYDDNRHEFYGIFDGWKDEGAGDRPEASDADWASFRSNMWDGEFVVTATEDEMAEVPVPMLVMMGNDVYHPQRTSRTIAEIGRDVTFVEQWKDEASLPDTDRVIKQFLAQHR